MANADAKKKQDQLVALLKEAVQPQSDLLAQVHKLLTASAAETKASLETVLGRLDFLEAQHAGGVAPERKANSRGGGAKKGGARKPAAPGDRPNLVNILMFFKYALSHDLDGARAKWVSDAALAAAKLVPAVAKKDPVTEEAKYWAAVGQEAWKTLPPPSKEAVKAAFQAWKDAAPAAGEAVGADAGNGVAGDAADGADSLEAY